MDHACPARRTRKSRTAASPAMPATPLPDAHARRPRIFPGWALHQVYWSPPACSRQAPPCTPSPEQEKKFCSCLLASLLLSVLRCFGQFFLVLQLGVIE